MKNNTQTVTLAETLRPLMQFCLRLTGKDGREWLEAFKRFLRKEEVWIMSGKWRIWKSVKSALNKPIHEMLIIKFDTWNFGQRIKDELCQMLSKNEIVFGPKTEEVFFAAVSARDLGLKPGFTQGELFERARGKGLDLCLSGDALEIIFQDGFELYENERLSFAMSPMKPTSGGPVIFWIGDLDHNGKYHFDFHNGKLDDKFTYPDNVNNKYIFRIRKRI